MTEAEWLVCKYTNGSLSPFGEYISSRKLRLFSCACGQRLFHILSHCRDAQRTHVRGCWVVYLVLDKN